MDRAQHVSSPTELGPIPFHIGTRVTASNAPFPDTLPFAIGCDNRTALVVQAPRPAVSEALERVYVAGSQIGTPMSDAGLGARYRDDFLGFVDAALGERSLEGLRVLEIGCGTGALLEQLGRRGARSVGLEPGGPAAALARERGLEVVNARFDPALFDGPFDLILHYAVLEHIEEPAIFLAQQAELLADEGVIACAVPSCGRQLEVGDLGMIVHEHWSYFTPESLRDLVVDGGGAVVDVQLAGVGGGAIYAAWRTGGRGRVSAPVDDPAGRFAQRAERSLAILRGRLEALDSNNRTLGIYCPARFFNYHHLLADSARPRIRYFDDDPHLAGRYYPPLPVRVEPRDTLLDQPVDELLIMSWSFGDALAAQLRSEPQLGGTALVTIGEIFG